MSEDEKKKNEFIQEQIRKKPFYKKKNFQKVVTGLGLAASFGAVAGFVFAIVYPWSENYFCGQARMVVIDETAKDTEEFTGASGDDEETAVETEAVETELERESYSAGITEKETKSPEEIFDQETGNLAYHQRLYGELTQVAKAAQTSLVTVTGLNSEMDLFSEVDESSSKAAGVVISQNNTSLFILTESSVTWDVEEIKVTFCDGSIVNAHLQKADEFTDLAVIRVAQRDMKEETLTKVRPALCGSSRIVQTGDPIIALGVDYMSFGMVISRPYLDICDGSYRQIKTDIIGRMENGGVLLNLKGQVVGIMGPNAEYIEDSLTLDGVGISEIQTLVDGLANGHSVPYFGIIGKEVTDALSEEFSMPKGVYVTKVEEDSPAMQKGIQTSDVIAELNGKPVENMKDFMAILQDISPFDAIPVRFWRKGIDGYKEIKIDVILKER